MNFPLYIAKRISGRSTGRFSGLIIRIAIAAIAISVAVMILATALIAGFKKEIRGKIFGFWGHVHIMHAGVSNILEARPIDMRQDFYPSLDTIRAVTYESYSESGQVRTLSTEGGIRHIQTFAFKPAILKANESLEGLVIKGVGKDFDWSYLEPYIEEGEMIHLPDSGESRQLLISRTTADRMQLGVGDAFLLYFVQDGQQIRRRFEVGGIYRTGLEDYDKRFALADIRVIQQLLGWEPWQVSGFELFVENIDDLQIYKQFLFREVLPLELYAETIREKDPAIFDWLDLQDINEAVILLLMIIVSIINMITALLILILERTNMIGTLKALGATNWKIQRIFLYNAGFIILLGLLFGNALGLGLGLLQDQFKLIRLSEVDYYLSYAPIHWDFYVVLLLNLGTLLITLLALIIPSFLVSSINPVKAIRFK